MTTEVVHVQNVDVIKFQDRLEIFQNLANHQIIDQDSCDYAVRTVKNGKEYIKDIETYYDPKIAELRKPYQEKLDEKNALLKPVESVIKVLGPRSAKWIQDENRRREQEHQRKLAEAEATRKQLEIEAKKKEEESFDIFADAPVRLEMPLVPVVLVATPPAPKVSIPIGNSVRKGAIKYRWVTRPENPDTEGKRMFIEAALKNPQLLDLLTLDDVKVKAMIKLKGEDEGESKAVPGIELYRDAILASRG